ncbi:MAG: RodZ domain-containing protein [Casimicrobiaceae bacterium]
MTANEEQLSGAAELPSPLADAGPGAQLRAAREAAGLSLDQVAQQLKLAPRQVKALEDENFGELPGRTFSRGFVRNYARLLNLDPQVLISQLPDAAHAPSLVSPALHSTGSMMAELPNSAAAKPNLARWLIPLALIGCIVAAAAYEWYRGGLSALNEPSRPVSLASDSRSIAPPAVTLPNPLAGEGRPAGADKAAVNASASMGVPAASALAPATSAATTSTTARAPLMAAPSTAVAATAPAVEPEPAAADAPLLIAYNGPSWTEIRDRTGTLLISRLVAADAVEGVRGTPPYEVVLGNARAVTLTYRGQTVDLTSFTRQNVARLTLQ